MDRTPAAIVAWSSRSLRAVSPQPAGLSTRPAFVSGWPYAENVNVGTSTMQPHRIAARRGVRLAVALLAAAPAAFFAHGGALAQAPAGVSPGKSVNLMIGFGAGGGYDIWGRLVAGHIGPHLPGN